MTDDTDYIYTEADRGLLEGAFTVRSCKWMRSVEKRAQRFRRLFHQPRGRIRERVVENPLVAAALGQLPPGSRVADIGGASSLLGLELVSLGHDVEVLDLRPSPLRHPRLTVRRVDLFENDLPDDSFDGISCISVIEHVGLERYGGKHHENGDLLFMEELRRLCRQGGIILLSAPYGRGHDPQVNGPPVGYRIYDRERLARLIADFELIRLRFFVMQQGCWVEQDQADADTVATSRPIDAIFFAELKVT